MFCGCFGWFEALNDRLIGPKSWNRIVVIFEAHLYSPRLCWGCFGCLFHKLRNKLYCGVYEAGNGYEIRVHKVEPILVDWPRTVTQGFHCSHE